MTHEDQDSDADLIRECLENHKSGGGEAFDTLYRKHVKVVAAFLRRLLPRDDHALNDALQESFVRFFYALPNFKQDRAVRPFLLTIARNVSLDHLKHSSRRETSFDNTDLARMIPDSSDRQDRERKELEVLIQTAIEELTVDQRAIFHLRKELSMSYEQAAEILGCSLRTAKYRMKAALERIGRELERLGLEV